jgi:hypothetical protein
MAKQAVRSPKNVTLTALVHHLTRTVLEALPEYDFEPEGKGVFCRHFNPVSYVISIEDLPDELIPEELQVFSNPDRRMRTLLSCLGDAEKVPIIEAIYQLYESEVKQIMTTEALTKKLVRMAGTKRIAAALGKQELLKVLSKEDLLKALSKKDILAALSRKDIIDAVMENEQLLKSLLKKLDREQLRKMLEGNGRNNRIAKPRKGKETP